MNIFSELKTRILQFLNQRGTISLLGWRKEVPLWVVLIVLIGAVTIYWVRYQSLEGQWKTYVNNRYGYSIDYPANWLIDEYGSNGSKGSIYLRNSFVDLFTAHLYIHEQDMAEPDLIEVIKWGEGLNRNATNWSNVETITIGQGDYEAMVRTHGFYGSSDTIKVYYVVTEHQAIALEFDPHKKDYYDAPEAFDRMLDSFQLIETGTQE